MFHPSEIEEFLRKKEENALGGTSPRLQYLASRWALKEALVKASGCTQLSYNCIYLEKKKIEEISNSGTSEGESDIGGNREPNLK